jgi:hypothetical protein
MLYSHSFVFQGLAPTALSIGISGMVRSKSELTPRSYGVSSSS